MNLFHIYTFEYMYIEYISINEHACTNISTYGLVSWKES